MTATTYILYITIVYYNMYEWYHIHITHNHCNYNMMNATTYILHITIVYYNMMNATTYILHVTIVYYNI